MKTAAEYLCIIIIIKNLEREKEKGRRRRRREEGRREGRAIQSVEYCEDRQVVK